MQPHHPTLVRKRSDLNEVPPSSVKRPKVTFNNDVDVRLIGTSEKAPEVIREEVRRALERHAGGDDTAYNALKEIYTRKPSEAPTPTTLENYTASLLANASQLNRTCSGLVTAVLCSQWLGREKSYVELFQHFLAALSTTQGFYLKDVLAVLADNLTSLPPSSIKVHNCPKITKTELYHRVHNCLRRLSRLIPSASGILLSVLRERFPHISDSKQAHVAFVSNLLKTTEYLPELSSDLLALITDKTIKIDAEVQVDLEDLAEDVEDGIVQEIPKLKKGESEDDDEEEESGSESDSSEDELDADAARAKQITGNIEKLDVLLDILFAYYEPLFSKTSLQVREENFEMLLNQFGGIILPAYRSRHTQFLLFHFAQCDSVLVDNFVGACVHIAFDKGRSSIIRQSAAAYLASFVSRGNHVSASIVRDVFDYIGGELTLFRANHEPDCPGPDLRRYLPYYSLVQALLYIFCFRWRDLQALPEEEADDDDDGLPIHDDLEHSWIPGIKDTFAQNVFSKLNPLKVCSPVIVAEFAKVAYHLKVIYVYHIIETNKRLRLSFLPQRNSASYPSRETALSGRKDESIHQLDEYFPFDPYHLPRSKRWIENDYREWKGVPGLDEEETGEKSDSESESEDEDSDEEEVVAATVGTQESASP